MAATSNSIVCRTRDFQVSSLGCRQTDWHDIIVMNLDWQIENIYPDTTREESLNYYYQSKRSQQIHTYTDMRNSFVTVSTSSLLQSRSDYQTAARHVAVR